MMSDQKKSKKSRGCLFYLALLLSVIFTLIASGFVALRYALKEARPWLEQKATAAIGAPVTLEGVHLSLWPETGIALDGLVLDGGNDCLPRVHVASALLLFDIESISERKIVLDDLLIRGVQIVLDAAPDEDVRAQCSAKALNPIAPSPVAPSNKLFALRSFRIEDATFAPRDDQSVSLIHIERAVAGIEVIDDRVTVDKFLGNVELSSHDFSATVEQVQYGLVDRALSVKGVSLDCAQLGSLELAELVRVSDGEYRGDLKTRLDARRLASFLKSLGLRVNSEGVSGELTGVLNFSGNVQTQQISGTIEGRNILSGKDRKVAENVKIDQLKVSLISGALDSLSASLSAKALDVIVATQRYRADTLRGPVTVRSDKGTWRFGGDIDLTRFIYSDEQTTVDRISGSIRKIDGTVKPGGDIVIKSLVTGDKIAVKSPGFVVDQAERLSAPITISIPAKGGYDVRGQVSFSNATMGSSRWRVNSAQGMFDIGISPPLKRFATKALRSRMQGNDLLLSGAFEIVKDSYLLRETHLTGNKIDFFIDGAYAKEAGGAVRAKSVIIETDIEKLVSLYDEKTGDPLDGTIKKFQTDFTAKRGEFLSTANGNGEFAVWNGRLSPRANLIRSMARAVQQVPVVSYLADIIVGEAKNNSKHIKAAFKLVNGKMQYDSLQMKSDNFSVEGGGSASLDGALDLKAEVIFARDTVSRLSFGISTFKKLLRSATAISIPILITGTASNPQVAVDVVPFMKRYSGISTVESIAEGALGVGNAIGDVLTSPFRSVTPTPAAPSAATPG